MFDLKSGLFQHTWGQFSFNHSTFSSIQNHFPHLSQKSFEQSKEMTAVQGLYCPSTQKLIQNALHEITVNSQS